MAAPDNIWEKIRFYAHTPHRRFPSLRCPFSSAADLMKVGNTVTIRNGKIDMFKGTMRLAVDKWGLIEEAEDADWEVKVSASASAVRSNTHPPIGAPRSRMVFLRFISYVLPPQAEGPRNPCPSTTLTF